MNQRYLLKLFRIFKKQKQLFKLKTINLKKNNFKTEVINFISNSELDLMYHFFQIFQDKKTLILEKKIDYIVPHLLSVKKIKFKKQSQTYPKL